jgi:hypothetical protein
LTNDDIDKLNPSQVTKLMAMDTPLARARQIFSSNVASIEQAGLQRAKLDLIQQRRMEFKAVLAIAKELGVKL